MNILEEIIYYKKLEIEKDKLSKPLTNIQMENILAIRDFEASLSKSGMSIIAEIKKASPSKGIIVEEFDPLSIGRHYEKSGVDAISVLTEKKYFLGNGDYVLAVKNETTKPILRKDFIVDEYQIYQSRLIGADAILLIAGVLKDKLKGFYETATNIGLHCLVEVHNKEELEIALDSGVRIIGINNRNLKDFKVDLGNTEALINDIPKSKIIVSESGINSIEDIRYLKKLGVDAVLIGEAFMRNPENINSFMEESHV